MDDKIKELEELRDRLTECIEKVKRYGSRSCVCTDDYLTADLSDLDSDIMELELTVSCIADSYNRNKGII